jgi:hypothetical protein
VSGHIAEPISQGETTMRTVMISIAAFSALITFAGMPSAVTALTEAQLTAPPVSAHQQFRVKNAVRTANPIHAPLFAS